MTTPTGRRSKPWPLSKRPGAAAIRTANLATDPDLRDKLIVAVQSLAIVPAEVAEPLGDNRWKTCCRCGKSKPIAEHPQDLKGPCLTCKALVARSAKRAARDNPPCPFPECPNSIVTNGYCQRHYMQHRKSGLSMAAFNAKHTGSCTVATCGSTEGLVLDHDHACCSGKGARCGTCERAFICGRCNRALFWIEEGLGPIEVVAGTSPLVEGLIAYVAFWKLQHAA